MRDGRPCSRRAARAALDRCPTPFAVDVVPLDEADARAVGELLGATGESDVADAHVAVLAARGDDVLPSDPEDMRRLLSARGMAVRVVAIQTAASTRA